MKKQQIKKVFIDKETLKHLNNITAILEKRGMNPLIQGDLFFYRFNSIMKKEDLRSQLQFQKRMLKFEEKNLL